jgi:predicted alpha/beta-fold hydrolase
MLFDKVVQRSLSKTYYKRLTNLNSDKSLQGLEIDWHLANTEMGFDNMIVEPILDFQPTYAYA